MVFSNTLDFGERRKDRGHLAVVGHGDARHLAAARADGFQRVFEGQAPAATSAPYSPRLCPMAMSGRMPYAAKQAGECRCRW